MRASTIKRTTSETDISVQLEIDGCGESEISTGIGFFDHMLHAFAKHSGFNLKLTAVGDLHIDGHHTIEDAGICLGRAFAEALSDKTGIARYGSFYVPMDEALAFCAVDISNRPFVVLNGEFASGMIGSYDTQLTAEFFRAFAFNALVTLHINLLYGENDHHKTEAAFKAFAHALGLAAAKGGGSVLSTKGVL